MLPPPPSSPSADADVGRGSWRSAPFAAGGSRGRGSEVPALRGPGGGRAGRAAGCRGRLPAAGAVGGGQPGAANPALRARGDRWPPCALTAARAPPQPLPPPPPPWGPGRSEEQPAERARPPRGAGREARSRLRPGASGSASAAPFPLPPAPLPPGPASRSSFWPGTPRSPPGLGLTSAGVHPPQPRCSAFLFSAFPIFGGGGREPWRHAYQGA